MLTIKEMAMQESAIEKDMTLRWIVIMNLCVNLRITTRWSHRKIG